MGIPMLRSCCCGCSLRSGTMTLAVVTIIFGVCSLAMGIVGITYKEESTKPEGESTKPVIKHETHVSGGIFTAFGALTLITGIMLCIGATQDAPKLLIPYMVVSILNIIASTIYMAMIAAGEYTKGESTIGTLYILSLLIYDALQAYFVLVVYSLYREQKENMDSI